MKQVYAPIWVGLLFSCFLSACGHASSENHVASAPPPPPAPALLTLEPHATGGTVRLPGILLPFEDVQLYPKVSGFVADVLVDRGSVVHKGTVLIRLEAPEMEDKLASARLHFMEAKANYLSSKDRYDRMKVIGRTPGTVSAYDLEAARDKEDADSAVLGGTWQEYKAQEDLAAYLTVTAPFDGVITERNVHPGALVGPGTTGAKPMLVLQELRKLRLVVNVPEQYTRQFNGPGKLLYSVNALPGKTFLGSVSRSAGALDDGYRSETIEADVTNDKGVFKPGMYAEVSLPVNGDADAFVVPKSAVVTTTERKYIVVDRDGSAHWVDVSLGNDDGDSTEVFGMLKAGDRALAHADYTISEGSKLSVH